MNPRGSQAGPKPPSREEIEAVVRQYYTLVPENPDQAFELLGPDLQSQGKVAHANFWRGIANVQIFEGPRVSGTEVEITPILTFRRSGGTEVPIRVLGIIVGPDGRPRINTDRSKT